MSKGPDTQRLLQEAARALAQDYHETYLIAAATTLRGFMSNRIARALLLYADSTKRRLDVLRLADASYTVSPYEAQLPTSASFAADLFRLFWNVAQPEGFTRERRAERPRLFTAELLLPRSNLQRLPRWCLLAILVECSEDPLVSMAYALQLSEGRRK